MSTTKQASSVQQGEATNPFDDLPPDEYDALLLDIEKRGIVYPVVQDQHGQTIDGHQRMKIANVLGIEYEVRTIEVKDEAERLQYAIALNAYRRHLSPERRRLAILKLAPTGMTQAEIAQATGTTQSTVSRTMAKAEANGGYAAHNLPDDQPQATDKQGRTRAQRGGRPRKTTVQPDPMAKQAEKAARRLDHLDEDAKDEVALNSMRGVWERMRADMTALTQRLSDTEQAEKVERILANAEQQLVRVWGSDDDEPGDEEDPGQIDDVAIPARPVRCQAIKPSSRVADEQCFNKATMPSSKDPDRMVCKRHADAALFNIEHARETL